MKHCGQSKISGEVQYSTVRCSTYDAVRTMQYVPNIPVVNTSFPLGARLVPEVRLAGTRASSGIWVCRRPGWGHCYCLEYYLSITDTDNAIVVIILSQLQKLFWV